MRESERDRLRATAEQLLEQPKLDLFERETLEQIRMDRAERIVRTRKRNKDLTEEQKQVKIARRRKWKKIGLDALEGVAGVAVGVAAGAVSDKLQD